MCLARARQGFIRPRDSVAVATESLLNAGARARFSAMGQTVHPT